MGYYMEKYYKSILIGVYEQKMLLEICINVD